MILSEIWTDFFRSKGVASLFDIHIKKRNEIALQNRGLVGKQVRYWEKALPVGLEAEDISSVGWIGLLNAVDTFDPNRGFLFSTWATIQIKGAIQSEMDKWRRKSKIPFMDEDSFIDNSQTAQNLAVSKELWDILKVLPRAENFALQLYFIDDIGGEQMVQALGGCRAGGFLVLKRALDLCRESGELNTLLKEFICLRQSTSQTLSSSNYESQPLRGLRKSRARINFLSSQSTLEN